jgi:surface antigen
MIEFMDILVQKRRFLIAGMFVLVDLLLVSFLVSAAQNHHASAAPEIHNVHTTTVSSPNTYDSPNVVTNALSMMVDDFAQTASIANQKMSSGAEATAMGAARVGKVVKHGTVASVVFTGHAVAASFVFSTHAVIGSVVFTGRAVVDSVLFTGHVFGVTFGFIGRTIGGGFGSTGHAIGSGFTFVGHAFGSIPRVASNITNVSSIIRPPDHTRIPVITQLRQQQAALIQSGTKDVILADAYNGTGGACDNGNGNGGYPMVWCNAQMDSTATISYSSDPINRECTSYAYWYFTSVEGFTSFRAKGDAKYWAATSNLPTHSTPAIGAIAVETAGAYGHVAIVHALPGQSYGGRTVPAGFVLVSEMNYDWNGHFRYSYSPLSKFSAYIYP